VLKSVVIYLTLHLLLAFTFYLHFAAAFISCVAF
jgi:hypothetical protein